MMTFHERFIHFTGPPYQEAANQFDAGQWYGFDLHWCICSPNNSATGTLSLNHWGWVMCNADVSWVIIGPGNGLVLDSTNSPVKIWEDPPQIATKTKWPPSCRKFCVDFKNEKFTKIKRVEPFQMSLYVLGPWEKLLKKWQSIFFFTIMKNISLFTTNMVHIYLHTQFKIMWMAGWLITKLFEGLYTEICKFKIKYFSSHLTSRRCFPHNFVIIQQICLVDGLNCFYKTHACYEQQETHLWNIFSDQYPLLLPLPPKFQNYIASHI